MQNQAVEEVSKDKEKWVELMMKYELGLEKPDPKRASKSAFNIGFSYIVGGLIPLSPLFFYIQMVLMVLNYHPSLHWSVCLFLVILKVSLPASITGGAFG